MGKVVTGTESESFDSSQCLKPAPVHATALNGFMSGHAGRGKQLPTKGATHVRKIWTTLFLLSIAPFNADLAQAGLIGGNVLISNSGARFPDAAYNSVNGTYLVIWSDYNQSPIRTVGRRIDANGAAIGGIFNINDGASYGLVPAACYNPTNNEWL